MLWRRRRRLRKAVSDKRGDDRGNIEEQITVRPAKAEKDGSERFEAPDTSRVAEAGGNTRAELDSGWRVVEVDGRPPR